MTISNILKCEKVRVSAWSIWRGIPHIDFCDMQKTVQKRERLLENFTHTYTMMIRINGNTPHKFAQTLLLLSKQYKYVYDILIVQCVRSCTLSYVFTYCIKRHGSISKSST